MPRGRPKAMGGLACGDHHANAPPREATGRGFADEWRVECESYFKCFETSFVISNMLTWRFPPNTARSLSSALIMVRFF